MIKNKLVLNLVFISCVLYYTFAAVGRVYSSRLEIFPFFHWGLFYAVPQKIQLFDVDIYKKSDSNFNKKIKIYDRALSLDSLKELRYNVELLFNCNGKICFDESLKEICNYINDDEKAFFIANERGKIDSIGVIENHQYFELYD